MTERNAKIVAAAIVLDGEAEWIAAAAAHCHCCPLCCDAPCAACLAGGVCDQFRCTCDDYDEDEEEEHDDW